MGWETWRGRRERLLLGEFIKLEWRTRLHWLHFLWQNWNPNFEYYDVQILDNRWLILWIWRMLLKR
jgi:hypothetical protein